MMPDVSKTSIDNILIDHLGCAKVCACEKLKEEVLSYLRGTEGEFYGSGTKKIEHRMQKRVNLNGDYVEKQEKV